MSSQRSFSFRRKPKAGDSFRRKPKVSDAQAKRHPAGPHDFGLRLQRGRARANGAKDKR